MSLKPPLLCDYAKYRRWIAHLADASKIGTMKMTVQLYPH